jgi:S1-C subfamily serine protease
MDEDESADGGGWEPPDPPDHPDQETIAFGYGGYPDGGSFGEDGYLPTGYGRYGATDHGATGYGTAGWRRYEPVPSPPFRPRRGARMLRYAMAAVLAAGTGALVTAVLSSGGASSSASPSPGVAASDIPEPHDIAAGSGSSSAPLNQAAVEAKVKPGLVDIDATLRYDNESAEGTGMILSPTGLVLTNNHVIDGATSVVVTLVGSRAVYQARVIGYDNTDDVALLQISGASGLRVVSFGNSAQVSLGTPVLALGNAQGKGGVTPALGTIDALNRSIQASDEGSGTTEDLSHMLQTDAEIQQGDSGGALVNNAGQVIGMITAAYNGSGPAAATMGFAIPINSALAIARLIAAGQASATVYIGTPGFLGVVSAQSASPDPRRQALDALASGRGDHGRPGGNGPTCLAPGQPPPGVPASIAPASTGVLVLGTVCGSAVTTTGLAPGDVITSVNGQAITTPASLTNITAKYHPGTVVSVGWEGVNGARHTTPVTLGPGPAR